MFVLHIYAYSMLVAEMEVVDELHSFSTGLCYLMTSGLSKDIQCHV